MGAEAQSYGSTGLSANATGKWHSRAPKMQLVHCALIVVFVAFGGGSFISKFGIHGASPLLFELVREAAVGPLLLIAARLVSGRSLPDRGDLKQIGLASVAFVGSQANFFIGLKHATPTVGSTWQATLPIFTTSIAVAIGMEKASWKKIAGILFASSGAIWMTIGALILHSDEGNKSNAGLPLGCLDGHVFFFGQAICNSLFFVASKEMASKYGATLFTAWMFSAGSVMFVAIVFAAKTSTSFSGYICEDVDPSVKSLCLQSLTTIPLYMVWPLIYEILVCSIVAWHLLSWALKYANPSMVSIYTVVQPCTACLLSLMVIAMKGRAWAESYGVTVPGLHNIFGAILIGAGLFVMFQSGEEHQRIKGKEEQSINMSKGNANNA